MTFFYWNVKIFILPKDRRSTYYWLRRWSTKAGLVKNIEWHTARRTFATWQLEHGADIYTISKLLGHKNIKQVAKYAQATDKLRREAIAALPEINL